MGKHKLSIRALLSEPDHKIADYCKSISKTALSTGSVYFAMWFFTWIITGDFQDISIRSIIALSIGGVSASFYVIIHYFRGQNQKIEEALINIATKHRDSEEIASKYNTLFEEALGKQKELEEVISTQLKEMNALVLELTIEKQKSFVKEKICKHVQEAIDNANR